MKGCMQPGTSPLFPWRCSRERWSTLAIGNCHSNTVSRVNRFFAVLIIVVSASIIVYVAIIPCNVLFHASSMICELRANDECVVFEILNAVCMKFDSSAFVRVSGRIVPVIIIVIFCSALMTTILTMDAILGGGRNGPHLSCCPIACVNLARY